MFRLYSKGCEYALRALAHLNPDDVGERFQAKQVCDAADIPESFTRKVFQSLVQGGFLTAVRGPGGGYVLTRAPEDISIPRVIHAVDGQETFSACILGLDQCNSRKPCPLHHTWAEVKRELIEKLESVSLLDVMETVRRRKGGWPVHESVTELLATRT